MNLTEEAQSPPDWNAAGAEACTPATGAAPGTGATSGTASAHLSVSGAMTSVSVPQPDSAIGAESAAGANSFGAGAISLAACSSLSAYKLKSEFYRTSFEEDRKPIIYEIFIQKRLSHMYQQFLFWT